MNITICICTWNRAGLLKETLETVAKLKIPLNLESKWEVMVVDNNSPDNTKEIVNSFSEVLPIRYEFVGIQGKSNALNHAIERIQAPWILFTDDDVRLPNDWLEKYWDAVQNNDENIVFFGGGVVPVFEVEPPEAMKEALPAVRNGFCGIQIPNDQRILDPSKRPLPVGANCAIRTDVLKERRFDPTIGPNGTTHITSEEWKMMKNLLEAGYQGRWLEGTIVDHFVPSSRLELKYIWRFYYGHGVTQTFSAHKEESKKLFKIPIWIIRSLFNSSFGCLFAYALGDRVAFYRNYSNVPRLLGQIYGYRTRSS